MAQKRSERESRWQERLENCRQSGLSEHEFCRREKLSRSALRYWREVFERRSRGMAKRPRARSAMSAKGGGADWVEVDGALIEVPVEAGSGFEVVVRGGRRIRLESQFDAEGLRRLVSLLESLPC